MAMTPPSGKFRIRRRGALLLLIATFAMAAPITGRHAMEAYAKDDGGDSGSDGGSDSGSDDGGSDDSGSDDGGSDNSGSDGSGSDDGGSGGNSGSGKSTSSSSGGSGKSSKSSSSARDSALATRLKGRIAPIGEIETLAGKVVPGEIIDVKLYRNKDRYIYKVKVIQRNGSIYDVRIDAVSRKLLSARER